MPFRDIVLTGFIFAILPICLTRPWLGIIAWYWFGLMNPHRLTWGFAYSMPFAMLIGGATLLGVVMAKDRKPIPWNSQLILVAVLLAYFTMTSVFAWAPAQAWAEWLKVFKIILMTLVATMFIYGHDRIRAMMWTVVISLGLYGVKSFFFVLSTGGAGEVKGPENSFLDGNTFIGLAFVMVIPLMVFMARGEKRIGLKRLLYAMAACTIVSTIFTFSRGAYLGLIAIIPLIWMRAEKKVIAACILVPAALLAPVVLPDTVFKRADKIEGYKEDRSANQRLQSWTVAFNLSKDYPLTGGGFEFEYAPDDRRWLSYTSDDYKWALDDRTSAAHSIYFQMLGQHGWVALMLFLSLLIGCLRTLGRIKQRALANEGTVWVASYASGLQVALVGYMVAGAFLSSAYFDLVWLYFGLTAILAREVPVVIRGYGLARGGGVASRRPGATPGRAMSPSSGKRNIGTSALRAEARGTPPRKPATGI